MNISSFELKQPKIYRDSHDLKDESWSFRLKKLFHRRSSTIPIHNQCQKPKPLMHLAQNMLIICRKFDNQ